MTESTNAGQKLAEAQLRELMADQASAICAKNVDRIMAHYDRDVVFYDCKTPFQTVGAEAFRRIWEMCLPYFPDSFGIETRDVRIFLSGDLAFSHCLFRFTGMDKDHPAMQTWLRSTVGYRKSQSGWQIVHEHCSVPFILDTSQALFTLEP
jgi:ketosteroid isomerase-like protein